MFLIPGDSPMGFRLPLQSLLWYSGAKAETAGYAMRSASPRGCRCRSTIGCAKNSSPAARPGPISGSRCWWVAAAIRAGGDWRWHGDMAVAAAMSFGERTARRRTIHSRDPRDFARAVAQRNDPSFVVRTALCIEPRGGVLHIFMPPLDRLEDYLELVTAIEDTSAALALPVVIEGYEPPHDSRINHIKVTPDPGVIEVNVHPAHHWDELVDITTGVYEDAR